MKNTIQIPKDIFENIFFAEGGTKKSVVKQLTGAYEMPLPNDKIHLANSEIEKNEYLLDSQGLRKAEGKTHEKGGTPVKLQEGTRIISDHLKIGVDFAKELTSSLKLPFKATDTYAKAMDRYSNSLGVNKINDELEGLITKMSEQKGKSKDKETFALNNQYLNNAINSKNKEKQPLEKQRIDFFNALFQRQEQTKKEQSGYEMKMGGDYLGLASKYNISPERAKELLNSLPHYQTGGKGDGKGVNFNSNAYKEAERARQHASDTAYGSVEAQKALQELYTNFPDLVYSDDTLRKHIDIDNRGRVAFKGDVKLNTVQPIIGSLQKKMDTRMRTSAQNIIDNPEYYGQDAVDKATQYLNNETFDEKQLARGFDSKLGQFTSGRYSMAMNLVTPEDKKFLNDNGIFTLRQLKNSPLRSKLNPESLKNIGEAEQQIGDKDADYSINQVELAKPEQAPNNLPPFPQTQGRNRSGLLLLPDQTPLPPSSIQPSLKVKRRYSRLDYNDISPEQQLQEQNRSEIATQGQLRDLSPEQRAAALIGLTANANASSNKVIADVNRTNMVGRNQIDAYNAKVSDAEENAAAQDALSYEQRTQTAIGNYDKELHDYYDTLNANNLNNWKTVEGFNRFNALNPDVQFTGNSYEINRAPIFNNSSTQYLESLNNEEKTKGKKSKVTTKKFGGRFKK